MAGDTPQEMPLRATDNPTNDTSTSVHAVDIQGQNGNVQSRVLKGAYGQVNKVNFYRRVSWLIPVIALANTVMFIITMYVNNCPKNFGSCMAPHILHRFSFQPWKENFLLGPSFLTLLKKGALVHEHHGWRLFSSMWLHGGLFHLLLNMLGLLMLGIHLEQDFGFVKIGLLYLIAGLGGSVMSSLFIPSSISVGASGAIFGLSGATLSEIIINWTIYRKKVAALVLLAIEILINLGLGFLPHVNNFGHIGGFLSGFLLGFVFLIRPQIVWLRQKYMLPGYSSHAARPKNPKYKKSQCALWIISLILLIVGFVAGLILVFRGYDVNAHCSWCRYLNCVPTSRGKCHSQTAHSCLSSQLGNQLNLTCSTNGKTKMYNLPNLTQSQLGILCSDFCG